MILAYREAPTVPLHIISDPYEFNGQIVVTAKTVTKSKNACRFGIYSITSLIEYNKQKE